MSVVSVLVAIILLLLALEIWLRSRRFYRAAKSIPGPKIYPLVGAVDFIGLDPGKLLNSSLN